VPVENGFSWGYSFDALILERGLLARRIPLSCSGRLLCFYLEKRKTKEKRVTGQGIFSMGASAGGVLDPGGEGLPGVGVPNRAADVVEKEKPEAAPERGAMDFANGEKIVGDQR
jgi:hypothetical protein